MMGENELAIARKARAAEGEAEELRAENARLHQTCSSSVSAYGLTGASCSSPAGVGAAPWR